MYTGSGHCRSRLSCGEGGVEPAPVERSRAIRPLIVSTTGLPPHQQFEAWRDLCVPYLDTGRPGTPPASGFQASGMALPFESFMYYHAVLPPYDYSRTPARIRRDSLDHWIVAVCKRGTQRQRSGDDNIFFRPGVPYVLTMARAFEAEREGVEIEWQSLFLARDAVQELEPLLGASLNAPLEGPTGRLLASFLDTLRDEAEEFRATDLPHLAALTKATLAAALNSRCDSVEAARPQLEHLQLARIKRLIREKLGSATLGPARLCAMSGVSRSALYRLFEPLGGVARHIQRERLAAAYRFLSDPADRRGIAQVAEAVGFFEPSSFSRAFRAEFGIAPRDLRAVALEGRTEVSVRAFGAAEGAAPNVSQILRRL
ncbi:helix-turn-helix domain-containing protein [Neoroseomonas rubea]|uniref:helix-turn-helix domain-containing protein n=1 Tax=Neoroseomonas rubea TaxID=2748666 RepID=UPI0018E00BBE|nr:helix-turn-helix domain-containing protein [Roseomonas rubea]